VSKKSTFFLYCRRDESNTAPESGDRGEKRRKRKRKRGRELRY